MHLGYSVKETVKYAQRILDLIQDYVSRVSQGMGLQLPQHTKLGRQNLQRAQKSNQPRRKRLRLQKPMFQSLPNPK